VRVVDFTQVMMGPVCTQMLADYGADILKIERKGAGDLSRSTFEPVHGADNPIFCSLNRNKRSAALDLRDPDMIAAVRALISTADVVVNNFRAGVMERMGLGYEDCRALNPRIIYAVGTGYGDSGPYAHKGGQDVLAQAMSGVMARRSDPSVPITVYPTALADYSAGMHMVQGILLALLHRARTGVGQKVSVSLYNSMLAMQMQEAAMIMMQDSEVNWAAMPLSGVFDTQDGALVMVGAFKANPLQDICKALEIEDLSADDAILQPEPAVQAQARAAADLPRTVCQQHAGLLARAPGRPGPAVCPGARPARGPGRPADPAQPDDHGGPGRRPDRALRGQPDPDVGCTRRTAPCPAPARPAHRRDPGDGQCRGAHMSAAPGRPKQARSAVRSTEVS
jgi:crotonobetainyl-CoA:carnitine CoA-transferase CaiB-like acyl-CoA transferase